ncbi:hypothetical protein Tco_0603281 [Tanacetum coccineum]
MSPGNMCHGGTNLLTEKYVGPTLVTGDCRWGKNPLRAFPSDHSPATPDTWAKVSLATCRWGKPLNIGNTSNVVVYRLNVEKTELMTSTDMCQPALPVVGDTCRRSQVTRALLEDPNLI